MDPITIVGLTASITSLISRAVTIGLKLQAICSVYRNAPRSFNLLNSEFSTMRLALNNLQNILYTIADEISSIEYTTIILGEHINELVADGRPARMVWNEQEIRELLEHFRAHKGSLLTLMMAMSM